MTLQGAIKQLHELRCNEDMPVFFKPAIAEVINVLLMDAKEVQSSECEYWDDESNFCTLYRPSAERHGRWVNCGWSIKCSICDYDMPFAVRNYCPNCGAKMDEVSKDE